MKKITELEFYDEAIFSMSKVEALEILAREEITNSEAMLLRWCREGKIEAVRVVGRAIGERGVYINPASLRSFIVAKRGPEDVEKLYIQIAQLKQENAELQARVDFLEEKYVKKKK